MLLISWAGLGYAPSVHQLLLPRYADWLESAFRGVGREGALLFLRYRSYLGGVDT